MDFRYLTETKNEFNNFLCSILVPHLYNGISGMLEYSIHTYNMLEEKQKKNKNIQNPGIINIFKMCLNDVSSINNYEIENEYKRIKDKSGCSEWFDNLIKASFKSYVLFLTWDPKTKNSKYSENDLYDKISLKDFIHKCYIETCEYFKENPEIFLKKGAKKEIYDIIKNCIETGIRKTLPYNEIIQEYLKINFISSTEDKEKNKKELDNIKSLLFRIMSQNKYGARPIGKALVSDSSDEKYNGHQHNSDAGKMELEKFIDMENINKNNHIGGKLSNKSSDDSENKEIFRPHSATNSRHNSLKSKSNSDSETSDNFQVPHMENNLTPNMQSTQLPHSNNSESDPNIKHENLSRTSKTSKTSKTSRTSRTKSQEPSQELSLEHQEINQNGGNLISSTQIMTRSEAKKKELEIELEMNKVKTTSETSKTSESNNQLNSPIPIRKTHTDRIYDDITPPNKMVGGDITKRKIQIIKNKSNSIHDKVSNMNNYFNNLMSN
jgi:hypothetical protein